MIMMLN